MIYIDMLLLVNFIIDYFLLLCAKQLSGASSDRPRLVLASGLGSLFSLAILLPPFPLLCQVLYKVATGAAMVLAAYRFVSLRHYLKAACWFLAISFLLGGAVVFAMFTFSLTSVSINNLNIYFDVSPILLLLCMLAVYLGVQLLTKLFPPPSGRLIIQADITIKEYSFTVDALYDTGFRLRDVLGGRQVLLVQYQAVKNSLPPGLCAALEGYFSGQVVESGQAPIRFVPFKTAAGEGVLPACPAQKVVLRNQKHRQEVKNVLLAFTREAVANGEFTGLMGEELAMKIT